MTRGIERALVEKRGRIVRRRWRSAGLIAAAALAILVIIPNTSESAAMAMEKIPVIGELVKVVTVRNYEYSDGFREAKVEIPRAEAAGQPQAIDEVNQSAADYADTLIGKFQSDVESGGESYQSLDVSYETVTDTKDWFTLKISVLETQASGYQYYRYYHIDKQTGKTATLGDLFREGADYKEIISEDIRRQMREQMAADDSKVYWVDSAEMPEDNFQSIGDDQNFYFDQNGSIVIAFDEYQVAPGYMGAPEFTIPADVLAKIRR